MKFKGVLIILLFLLAIFSCSKAPDDPFCRYEPLVASAGIRAGQGAVQIMASADEYFYILEKTGKEVTHGRLNMSASVKPGDYDARVNNSTHSVHVRENTLTKCSAGAVLLRGSTDEYYYMLDSTGHEMAHNKLGRGLHGRAVHGSYLTRRGFTATLLSKAHSFATAGSPTKPFWEGRHSRAV